MGGSGFGINTMKELTADKLAATVQSYHGNNDQNVSSTLLTLRYKELSNGSMNLTFLCI